MSPERAKWASASRVVSEAIADACSACVEDETPSHTTSTAQPSSPRTPDAIAVASSVVIALQAGIAQLRKAVLFRLRRRIRLAEQGACFLDRELRVQSARGGAAEQSDDLRSGIDEREGEERLPDSFEYSLGVKTPAVLERSCPAQASDKERPVYAGIEVFAARLPRESSRFERPREIEGEKCATETFRESRQGAHVRHRLCSLRGNERAR
jgi:hypothetical protein